jgi:hypothetical protein
MAPSRILLISQTATGQFPKSSSKLREIDLTLDAIRQGGSSPIPFEELTEVSEATIAIEEAIARGEAISLRTTPIPAEQKTAEKL